MPKYHVIYEDGDYRTFSRNDSPDEGSKINPGIWTDQEAAQDIADSFNRHYSQPKYRVCEIGDGDLWKLREDVRFADNQYINVPWRNEEWYLAKHGEHYCHLSVEQIGKIAFTENEAKGKLDRQTVMKPGRYLARYFSDVLSNEQIEQWAAQVSVEVGENALTITQDADEIEEVYLGGPSSCMSYPPESYKGQCHPTRVYAGPDTALAYIGPREDATGRSVVWPEKKIYTRLYGDTSRLRLLLENAGYTPGYLDGARIQRIENENGCGVIVPYIDHGGDLADDGEYLIIGRGDIPSGCTEGVSETGIFCSHCDEYEDEGGFSYITDVGESWCSSCTSNDSFSCDATGNSYSDDVGCTQVFSFSWGSRTTYTIADCNLDEFGAVWVDNRDEYWKADDCYVCADTGESFVTQYDPPVEDEDGNTYCQESWDAMQPEPLDDADPAQANAHVRAWSAFTVLPDAYQGPTLARPPLGTPPPWAASIGSAVNVPVSEGYMLDPIAAGCRCNTCRAEIERRDTIAQVEYRAMRDAIYDAYVARPLMPGVLTTAYGIINTAV